MILRYILLLTALLVVGRKTFAQNVDYTNGCSNEIANADDQLIQDAFDFVRNHEADVFDEIDRIRSSGNTHSYSFINNTVEDEWQDEVDDGDIKIDCHYNASNNKCSNSPGSLGWTVGTDWWTGVRDRVHVCVNNVRTTAGSSGHETALMVGIIAQSSCTTWTARRIMARAD